MRAWLCFLILIALVGPAPRLHGGGSGLNTVLVVNQASSNSLALANYYAEQRQVPPQNIVRMTNWTGGNVYWTATDFTNKLLQPLLGALQSRGLTQQVWQVVLSMDIPYRVDRSGGTTTWNSTTAALLYGFKLFTAPPAGLPWSCSLPDDSANSYAFSEAYFPEATPATAATNSLLAFMLTGNSLAQAKSIVDRGVASDRSYPTQAIYLARTTDAARNVRYYLFDDAIFNARVIGDNSLVRTNTNSTAFTNTLGLMTGLANLTLPANAFVPGTMADSLTSYGGTIFNPQGQTTLLAFLEAGAVGSYGTVVEPCNYLEKFPSPLNYFYQARGFSVAESYYQSLANPFEGLLVGDPLAQPFARPGYVTLPDFVEGQIVSGTAPLRVQFAAADATRPVYRLDLFVDGVFHSTLTKLGPTFGNRIAVTLPGHTVNYNVPANSTVNSVASGLASAINLVTNLTSVAAYPFGDRLELHGLNPATPGSGIGLSVTNSAGSGAQITTLASATRATFLDSVAMGYSVIAYSNAPLPGDWIRLTVVKTNGTSLSFAATNSTGTNLAPLVQSVLSKLNASPTLQSPDGVVGEDYFSYEPSRPYVGFAVRARAAGWPAAQVQLKLDGSATFTYQPQANLRADGNYSDLRPRNHIYIASGVAAGDSTFMLDTTTLADGYHDLAVVAYDGTSVRTQARVARRCRVQNTALSASLTPLVSGTNAALEGTLRFRVQAGAGAVASLEFGTTGGVFARSNAVSAADFAVAAAYLSEGLHPIWAVATNAAGNRYRTETQWVRVVAAEAPFRLTLNRSPWELGWQALAGRTYQVLSANDPAVVFQIVGSVTATNNFAQFALPAPGPIPAFYRVRGP